MTSLVNPGLGIVDYQDEGSVEECLREDVKTLREEFWEDGAVKQQRPSAKRLKVKGTEREGERPRDNEVIGTLNGPAIDGGEWERWGRVTGVWTQKIVIPDWGAGSIGRVRWVPSQLRYAVSGLVLLGLLGPLVGGSSNCVTRQRRFGDQAECAVIIGKQSAVMGPLAELMSDLQKQNELDKIKLPRMESQLGKSWSAARGVRRDSSRGSDHENVQAIRLGGRNDRLKGEENSAKGGDLMIRMKVGNEGGIKKKKMLFKMKEGQQLEG
ncbi:hypothetical protein IWW34DRAFT_780701 [Fusarium oxysporum f. sp. albedinis]|nr:hypothetical protein IWW34DRAFT_780701 [Fusarium oxysporum f. sp. albedinis]